MWKLQALTHDSSPECGEKSWFKGKQWFFQKCGIIQTFEKDYNKQETIQ